MLKRHNHLFLLLLRGVDWFSCAAAWGLGYLVLLGGHHLGWLPYTPPTTGVYIPAVVVSLILQPLLYSRFALYVPKRTTSLAAEMATVAKAVVVAWALTLIVVLFAHHLELPRSAALLVLGLWLGAAMAARLVGRGLLRFFRRRGWNTRSAAIVGVGRLGQTLYHTLRRNPWTGIQTLYFVDDAPRASLLGLPVHHGMDDIEQIVQRRPVNIVFIALSGPDRHRAEDVANRLGQLSVDVRLVPDLMWSYILRHDVNQLDNLTIVSLTYSPQHGWNSLIKRLFDLTVSAGLLVVLSPLLAAIAAAVKLTSRGPFIYAQQRESLAGKRFRIYKFRTMRADAESRTGPVWSGPDDNRITPLGRFLRRTSLDELPQLCNVLVGDLSLVGPRPERPELIDRFRQQIPRYMLRSQIKAGLTGWAQIHGYRGQTSLRKRIQYDLYYIRNWTFGLDLLILLRTILGGFRDRGAS